jgi:thiol-disulfide isomerase/thioredoxin
MKINRFVASIFVMAIAAVMAASGQTVLTGLDGSRVDVQGQRGKVVILAIGASWLPLSAKQADYANSLAKKYAGRDVVVYFVSTESDDPKSKNFASNDDLKKFATANKIGFSVLRDTDGTATLRKFKVDQLPSFVVLDKNGAPAGEVFGGIDPKYDITVPISKTVDRLL